MHSRKISSAHALEEPTTMSRSYMCQFCSYLFTSKSNCLRHEKNCSSNHLREPNMFYCPNCKIGCIREDNLRVHVKKCFSKENGTGKKSKTPCLIEECNFEFYHKSALINHIRHSHPDISVKEPIIKTFQTFEEFLQWKDSEEESTCSYFTQKNGMSNHDKISNLYYYCQHDGSAKDHSVRKTNKCARRGRIKAGHFCIAKMKVWEDKNKTFVLQYFPTHSHQYGPKHLNYNPLPESTSTSTNEEIAEEVSPIEVFKKITPTYDCRNRENVKTRRGNVLTKQKIREKARRLYMSLRLNKDSANPKLHPLLTRGKPIFRIHKLNEDLDQCNEHLLQPTEENNASDRFNSIVSRLETNMSVINNFVASAKQKKVEEHVLSHMNCVLSNLVLQLQSYESDKSYKIQGNPMELVTFRPQEKLKTQLSQYLAFKMPKCKRKTQFDSVDEAESK
ncbi:uncharacterized protein LOC124367790 [Homalodisca vitripennis]|uniref:uncharacterized protein LOC124367790 n=1 Tax=Homalodisca vitripennis TaxID=197043 RepID=UPI001EEB0C08|nr:uncharacterized protein LOC124367790 [Homalodisca vitripennis]